MLLDGERPRYNIFPAWNSEIGRHTPSALSSSSTLPVLAKPMRQVLIAASRFPRSRYLQLAPVAASVMPAEIAASASVS